MHKISKYMSLIENNEWFVRKIANVLKNKYVKKKNWLISKWKADGIASIKNVFRLKQENATQTDKTRYILKLWFCTKSKSILFDLNITVWNTVSSSFIYTAIKIQCMPFIMAKVKKNTLHICNISIIICVYNYKMHGQRSSSHWYRWF